MFWLVVAVFSNEILKATKCRKLLFSPCILHSLRIRESFHLQSQSRPSWPPLLASALAQICSSPSAQTCRIPLVPGCRFAWAQTRTFAPASAPACSGRIAWALACKTTFLGRSARSSGLLLAFHTRARHPACGNLRNHPRNKPEIKAC